MAPDRSFSLIVDEYVPYICTAIHDGGNVRKELRNKCNLSKFERWQEEDPYTGDFISSFPIRLIAHDSRYEYDLNRAPHECIYTEAWGKNVWTKPFTKKEFEASKKKHHNFYKVLHALVAKIEDDFDSCLVFDIHSYNYKRIEREAPLFNVGTKNIPKKFHVYTREWLKNLAAIDLPFVENSTKENDVFFGHGHLLKYLTGEFKNTLVLATEIKKVYLDEESGDVYPEIILAIKEELKRAITLQAKFFVNEATNITVKKRHTLLSSELTPLVKEIDSSIFRLMKNFEILSFVSPTNIETEKKNFFKSKFKKSPNFRYPPLHIDSAQLKRELYALPITSIEDITLQNLYVKIIDSYADQIDLLSCREEEKFLYASLKFFGAPSADDLRISNFLITAPKVELFDKDNQTKVDSKTVQELCQKMIDHFNFNGRITLAKNMVAHAVFHPGKNLLKIKANSIVNQRYAKALAHHEIGVHMLTTENAKKQPLKIFQLGLPLDTKTQEGLAILSEYLSGHIAVSRLKELALRVLAVNHMIKNYDFSETFNYLVTDFGIDTEIAFYLTARVYRGGGFTKDYLYLSGFKEIYQLFLSNKTGLEKLLIGKTSIEDLPTISELLSREILPSPTHIPVSYQDHKQIDDKILNYVVSVFNAPEE